MKNAFYSQNNSMLDVLRNVNEIIRTKLN